MIDYPLWEITTLTNKNQNLTDRIWDFFCSLKLTIILLLSLAATSVIGTVIQQNASPAEYIREYGQSNYELFKSLQFTDMYHSTWFIGILALFSINLICCSIKTFPRVWRFVRQPQLIPAESILKSAANRTELILPGTQEARAEQAAAFLKKEFATTVRTDQEGKTFLFAQKGIYSRFGAYITHLSILIIMAGAIIGNIWGYKGYVNIDEGAAIDQVRSRNGGIIPLGFTVRCDDFNVSYYQGSNRPKDYNSDLVILENGREIMRKRIEVNDPLTYKGITFYQSSYGNTGTAMFKLKVTDNGTGDSMEVSARRGAHTPLPNGYSFAVNDYTDNDRNYGPAIQLHVNTPDGKHGNPFVVWQNYPDFDKKRGGTFSFSLLAIEQPQFTGLQVSKDPGVNIVWAGCFLMVFGSLTAFFFSHRRLWVCLEEHKGKIRLTMAANAHRNQPGFALAFEDLANKFEAALTNSSSRKEG